MEKTEAYAILAISIESSRSEVESAFQNRTREVRARFLAARGMSMRAQYQREFVAIRDARDCLLTEFDESSRKHPKVDEPPVHVPPSDDPRDTEPRLDQPEVDEPRAHKPRAHEPRAHEPRAHEPRAHEPRAHEPRAHEPRVHELQVVEPRVEEPKVDWPRIDESKIDGPQVEEPKIDVPRVDESKVDVPRVHEPRFHEIRLDESPGVAARLDDLKADQPKIVEPRMDEPKIDEQPVLAPRVDQRLGEGPRAVEQPGTLFGEDLTGKSPPPTVSTPDQLSPGQLFVSRFELQRELETGSTGEVWLAQDHASQRQVALMFLPDLITGDKAAIEDLRNEIRRRAALNHSNILQVFDLVEDQGRVAIEIEYPAGRSLSELRFGRPNHVFEVGELKTWVKELCQALHYAHESAGLIHGNIQPSNLFVDRAGSLKVKDFGLSNCINESISRLTGTPQTSEALQYKSPQQAAGEKPAIADDLYSLGATLYESLTGKPPFSARDIALQVTKKPPSMKERRAELGIAGENIPKNWEEIVADCLAEDANQRPQSASEVAKRLENAIPPSGVPLGTATPPSPPPPPSPPAEVRTAPISKALPSVLRLPARKLRLAIVGFIFILVVVSVIAFLAVHLNRLPPTKDPSPTPAASSSPSGTAEKENSLRDATTPLAESPTSSPAESPTVSPGESFKVSPAQSPTVSPGENPTPSSPATANPEEKQFAGPSSTPLSPIDINATKEDVIRRINALPGVTADKKANLIEKIDRARSMERLTVIPFEVGQTILHRPATDELLRTINSPQMRDKLSDPTIILVMLGFADTGGSPDLNLRISRERAEYVGRILKERAKLLNAMQTIGMGGSELLDSKRPGQNRAVEVWAVEPW